MAIERGRQLDRPNSITGELLRIPGSPLAVHPYLRARAEDRSFIIGSTRIADKIGPRLGTTTLIDFANDIVCLPPHYGATPVPRRPGLPRPDAPPAAQTAVPRPTLRLLVSCLSVMALGMGLGGCGDGANEAVSSESVVEWTVPVPEFTATPLDELWGDVLSPPGPGPEELSLLEIPAAVFDNNSGRPRTSEPAWQELITLACDPEGVVQAALANGWDIVVTGFVDSVGGHGPGTRNDELQLERAEAAEAELLVSCEAAGAAIPSERVLVARGGIAPDDTRKVVVTLTRNQEDDQ